MAVEDVKSVCSFSGVEELHVLAVDDSLVDRKVIERLLKNSCCKVTAVDSGSRALQYLGLDGERIPVGFDELKVNLIITDYSMPGMTGYELLKKIKGSTQLSQIPVVIMSSENILTRIDRCLEEGAEDFLVKPVKLSDVERLREFVLRGEDRIERAVGRNRKTSDDDSYISSPSPSSLDSSPASSPESVSAETHHQPLAKRPRLPSSSGGCTHSQGEAIASPQNLN